MATILRRYEVVWGCSAARPSVRTFSRTGGSIMGPRGLLALSAISLVAVVVLDLHFSPDHNLAILYAVPVLLASFIESAVLVVLMSALVLILDLLSVLQSKPPLDVWSLSVVALLVVCYLALQVAGQRALIRRQVEE